MPQRRLAIMLADAKSEQGGAHSFEEAEALLRTALQVSTQIGLSPAKYLCGIGICCISSRAVDTPPHANELPLDDPYAAPRCMCTQLRRWRLWRVDLQETEFEHLVKSLEDDKHAKPAAALPPPEGSATLPTVDALYALMEFSRVRHGQRHYQQASTLFRAVVDGFQAVAESDEDLLYSAKLILKWRLEAKLEMMLTQRHFRSWRAVDDEIRGAWEHACRALGPRHPTTVQHLAWLVSNLCDCLRYVLRVLVAALWAALCPVASVFGLLICCCDPRSITAGSTMSCLCSRRSLACRARCAVGPAR